MINGVVMKIFILFIITILCCGCQPIVKENIAELNKFNDRQLVKYDKEKYPLFIENINSLCEDETYKYNKPPQRVVAVWQNSIETLMALGVGDRIIAGIGVPSDKYFRPEYRAQYRKIPYTSLQNLDIETILMLEPDIIIGWFSTFSPKVLRTTDFWHKRGIGTYIAPSSTPEKDRRVLSSEYQDIVNLGKIFDREEIANRIVNSMKKEIEFVTSRAKNFEKKPRGLVVELSGKEMIVYGEKTLVGDIIRHLGAEQLAAKYTSISAEQILELDPDALFIVVIESNYGNEESIKKRITNHKALKHLRCVKNNRVYTIPLYAIYSSGVRTYDGIKILANGLYPELYKE